MDLFYVLPPATERHVGGGGQMKPRAARYVQCSFLYLKYLFYVYCVLAQQQYVFCVLLSTLSGVCTANFFYDAALSSFLLLAKKRRMRMEGVSYLARSVGSGRDWMADCHSLFFDGRDTSWKLVQSALLF